MTVASAVEGEVELDRLEEHHICPEKALADLLAQGAAQRQQFRPSSALEDPHRRPEQENRANGDRKNQVHSRQLQD